MRFIIYSQIKKMFELPNNGWFIHLEGSRESLFLGAEKPPFEVGDLIKISIEKVEPLNANP
jgi:hypothetical protein